MVAGLREDLRALPEATDSNLVWGQPCPAPRDALHRLAWWGLLTEKLQGARTQKKVLPRGLSSRQAFAVPPALIAPPEQPAAVRQVSPLLVEQTQVLQALGAEALRVLLELVRAQRVGLRPGWAPLAREQ
jgi:hypothetical protein